MESVECEVRVECKVWNVKCAAQSVGCKVWSVKCEYEVRSVKSGV